MESAVIVTYRCNARCLMCHTWQHPSRPEDEFKPEILASLPSGQTKINITGGEPTIRKDLIEIARVLHPKTSRLEIISNGFYPEKLIAVAREFPDMTFRISLEGLPSVSDEIRGLKGGFDRGLRSLLGLLELGVRDVGISMTVSDENVGDLLPFYHFAARMGLEFTQCVPHNSHYFHKHDNEIRNKEVWAAEIRNLMKALLTSRRRELKLRVKDWFRAYLNLGLLLHVTAGRRPLKCGGGSDFFFVDPYGDILPCNGMAEKDAMGNLKEKPFDEIWNSEQARAVRGRVAVCTRGCWMVGSAVPAMRRNLIEPLRWVVRNKVRLALKKDLAIS
jgi:MoaA/NifB/PqqE/SkfB family radical SAM enzyme